MARIELKNERFKVYCKFACDKRFISRYCGSSVFLEDTDEVRCKLQGAADDYKEYGCVIQLRDIDNKIVFQTE